MTGRRGSVAPFLFGASDPALDFAIGLYESPRPDMGHADGPLLFRIVP